MKDYAKRYDEFVDAMKKGLANAEDASTALVDISRMFIDYNTKTNEAFKVVTLEKAKLIGSVDQATLKPMTSAKVETLIESTPGNHALLDLKCDLENINSLIAACKYFQQSLSGEFDKNKTS